MKKGDSVKYLIGVDEVGRGPLAGPVLVGVVAIEKRVLRKVFLKFSAGKKSLLRDSKKMTAKQREEVFEMQKNISGIFYTTAMCSAKEIDKIGIQKCIFKCIEKCLKDLSSKGIKAKNSEVRLDGALRAPSAYPHQKTIIRGDSSEPIISLASIIAKVTRDSHMQKLHKKFPQYNFAQNKGYGTKTHIQAIKKHGLSTVHRKSFCTKIKV